MALDILTKEPSLNWTEDNQLYDCCKAWRKRVEMLITGMTLGKEPKESICRCIKACSGETGQTPIESVGHTCDDATSTKYTLNATEGHCKPRSNEIGIATAYKQCEQGNLGIQEYKESVGRSQQHAILMQPMTDVFGMQSSLGLVKKRYMRVH